MRNMKIIASVVLLIAVILGISFLAPDKATSNLENSVASSTITAMQEYSDGKYTVRGIVDLPSPCYTLTDDVMVQEPPQPRATLQLNVAPPEDINKCIQVVDPRIFTTTFNASEGTNIEATINSEPAKIEFVTTSSPYFTNNSAGTTTNATTSYE